MLFGRRLRAPGPTVAAAGLVCVLTLLASTSHAQSTSDDLARRHFDSGVAYLEESDYDNALKAFQKAYDLSKRPEILLNIATVHERQSDLAGAVAALKAYLDAAPQGEHVETVKLRIQNLEKRLQEQGKPKADAAPPAAASPAAPASPATPAPAPAPTAPRHAEAEPNRLPAFISLGVGGVVAGASLATGLVAKSKYDDAKQSCGHACTDSQLSSSRTFAITSTVLTGGAVLGVGLGVALLLTSERDSDDLSQNAPRFDVALGPTAAAASAAWSF
jgi:tetratricopeptide (TPR) repeat protein